MTKSIGNHTNVRKRKLRQHLYRSANNKSRIGVAGRHDQRKRRKRVYHVRVAVYGQFYFSIYVVQLSVPRSKSDSGELTGQLAEARWNVFNQNDQWKITFPDGTTRERTFFYSYHPGHQLRLA